MDLRQLQSFVTVARERNVTRAAKLLNIAQPPLSRQIQQLEEELGATLLLRTSRPLRLTDAGKLFYEQALQILGRVEQMKSATRRVARTERSVFSIGFVPSVLYSDLPILVRRIRQQSPSLDVSLLEMTSIQQMDALKLGRIDIGLGRMRFDDPSVKRLILREERLIAAIPLDSPLAHSNDPLAMRAIAAQHLIVYPKEPRPSFADHILSVLGDHGAGPLEVHEVHELQTALGLVAAGVGICFIPSSARVIRNDLHYRVLEDEFATSPIILSHRVNDQSQNIPLVVRLLRELYAENPPWLADSYIHLTPEMEPSAVDESLPQERINTSS